MAFEQSGQSLLSLRLALERCGADFEREQATLLQRIGVVVLSLTQLDYYEKAKGGTGADGTKWKPLDPRTVAARVRKRGAGRRLVDESKRLTARIQAVTPPDVERQRRVLRARRRALQAQLRTLIQAAISRHEIGVDTGLQRASASPGFQPADGEGGNVFQVDGDTVRVGYGREYSEYFDADRPLLPDDLPESWEAEVDHVVLRWAEEILGRYFR